VYFHGMDHSLFINPQPEEAERSCFQPQGNLLDGVMQKSSFDLKSAIMSYS